MKKMIIGLLVVTFLVINSLNIFAYDAEVINVIQNNNSTINIDSSKINELKTINSSIDYLKISIENISSSSSDNIVKISIV